MTWCRVHFEVLSYYLKIVFASDTFIMLCESVVEGIPVPVYLVRVFIETRISTCTLTTTYRTLFLHLATTPSSSYSVSPATTLPYLILYSHTLDFFVLPSITLSSTHNSPATPFAIQPYTSPCPSLHYQILRSSPLLFPCHSARNSTPLPFPPPAFNAERYDQSLWR